MTESHRTIQSIRADFPLLEQELYGRPLVYLDNAATTQVPSQVLDRVRDHYLTDNANVHRGIHTLSNRSTRNFEDARQTVAAFINAKSASEVVFTSGTTDSINTLARLLAPAVKPGQAIVASALEHHANFVPWQQLCKQTGAKFIVAPLDDNGEIDRERLAEILEAEDVFLVAFAHVSNVLGTVSDAKAITALAHDHNALAVVDAAQSIRHELVDVQNLDCDFLAFSGHKTLALTGIGVLYGKQERMAQLRPVNFGGEMVDKVTSEETTFEEAPIRFEAGTPNYVGAISLAAALDYISQCGREFIRYREHELLNYAEQQLLTLGGIEILGGPKQRGGCVSFVAENAHPFDIATFIDKRGVALRSGNQCAQPLLHEVYNHQVITRLSPAFYNTKEEIDICMDELDRVLKLLRMHAI